MKYRQVAKKLSALGCHEIIIVDPRINETLQTGAVENRTYPDNKFIPIYRGDRSRPAPIISLPRFIGGIETEWRKCPFVF